MNIKHCAGGEPEIKLDAAETRALRRAKHICAWLGAYAKNQPKVLACDVERNIEVLLDNFGRPDPAE